MIARIIVNTILTRSYFNRNRNVPHEFFIAGTIGKHAMTEIRLNTINIGVRIEDNFIVEAKVVFHVNIFAINSKA